MNAETERQVTLSEALLASSAQYPSDTALNFRESSITYAELMESVARLAAGLDNIGVGKGDKVALLLPNCPEFVTSYFAITSLGGICVPCNVLLKPDELAYIYGNAEVKAVISIGPLLPALLELKKRVTGLEYIIGIESEAPDGAITLDSLMTREALDISGRVKPEDTAAIIYTSGTTGRPKGAMLTHGSITWDAEACIQAINFTHKENLLCAIPLFHSFAATVCMVLPVLLGAKATLVERFMPALVLDTVQQQKVTVFVGVPTMYAALLQFQDGREYDLSSLWLGVTGGAPMPQPVQEAAQKALGVPIIEGYGPTECSPVVSVNRVDNCKMGSVGLPLTGVEVRLCDDCGNVLTISNIGEIEVKGKNVMQGYLGLPAETSEVLRDGWLRTGDLGMMDKDGFLYIIDRKKDMLIVGGLNVYPREVEDVIYSHPKIAECAVIGVQDGLRGEVPKAFVVPKLGEDLTGHEIIAHCRKRIANYKVPRAVEIRDTLPKSGTGKILKRALRDELKSSVERANGNG